MSGKKQQKQKGKNPKGKPKNQGLTKAQEAALDSKQRNEIIDEVLLYPQIYDKKHQLYKRTDLKRELFEKIATKTTPHPFLGQLSGDDVETRWKSLVDKYRTKIDASGSEGKPVSEKAKQWQFFDQMGFMKDYVGSRK